jgi:hypothetical protein
MRPTGIGGKHLDTIVLSIRLFEPMLGRRFLGDPSVA